MEKVQNLKKEPFFNSSKNIFVGDFNTILKENGKQKTKFKQNLLDFVSNHIKAGNFVFSVEFYLGDKIEFKIISNELLNITYKKNNSNFIFAIYESKDLFRELFYPIVPENHKAIYKIFTRFYDM
jgi:hypothetical protein